MAIGNLVVVGLIVVVVVVVLALAGLPLEVPPPVLGLVLCALLLLACGRLVLVVVAAGLFVR